MTNLKRYNLAPDTLAGVTEHPEGSFVHWNDYERLLEHIGKMGDLHPGAWRDLLKQAAQVEPSAPDFRALLFEAEDYVREDQKELRQRIADALHPNRRGGG